MTADRTKVVVKRADGNKESCVPGKDPVPAVGTPDDPEPAAPNEESCFDWLADRRRLPGSATRPRSSARSLSLWDTEKGKLTVTAA